MSVEIEDTNHIDDLIRVMTDLERYSVEIGILGASSQLGDKNMLKIAVVHEFGMKIKVTPKMRAWFAYQGYPIKKETIEINIPERSFIRSGWDKNVNEISRKIEAMLQMVLELRMSPEAFYNNIGAEVAGMLQTFITDLRNPALSEMTVARRRGRSNNPLIDSGDLSERITWEVVKG